ncbi:MAG: PLP-dependent aminotransferase family protein [Acidisphaera sp.]|nr:PLP-dependent aminotransferase family protein [Acidisphaera sp.]
MEDVLNRPGADVATEWLPGLAGERRGATKHKRLADGIIADIDRGVLPPGAQLPPQRDLAQRLGLSVQTVGLGYKEAERRGYLRGEVGRGTFVRSRVTERADRFMLDRSPTGLVDLSIIRAAWLDAHEQASRALMAEMAASENSVWMRPCRPIAGLARHREAAARWLARLGVQAEPDRILVTGGAAHAVFLALATVVRPGDLVLTECLTDHGVIGLASVLGYALRGLPCDAEGVLPDALAEACAGGQATALVLVPSLGNPTGHLAGAERRRQIADVARRHRLFVVEDEVCKPLLDTELPSIAGMLPELGFFATSFTKSVMTGLRAGYLVVPPQFAMRTTSILRVTSWSGVPAVAEMATRWVESGAAAELLSLQRAEIRARQEMVRDVLGAYVAGRHPLSLTAWLHVPERWTEEQLILALAARGIAVTPSDPFVAGGEPRGGLRVAIGGRYTHEQLRAAFATIRTTLAQVPPVHGVAGIA